MSSSRGLIDRGHPSRRRAGVFAGRNLAGWIRAFLALVARPHLWPVAVRQAARIARPRWWRHRPFLPLPDAGYLRFRLETAYGDTVAPSPSDLVSYLEWCRALHP